MKKCRYCGEENPDNKNWCKKCMKPLRDDPAEVSLLGEKLESPPEAMNEERSESESFRTYKAKESEHEKTQTPFGIYRQKSQEPESESGRLHGGMGPKRGNIPEEKLWEKEPEREENHGALIGNIGNIKYVKDGGRNSRIILKKPQRCCIYCGEPIDGDGMVCQRCSAKNIWKKISKIACALFAVICCVVGVHYFVGNKNVNLTDEQIKISCQNYFNVSKEINTFESKFTDENGYVDITEVDTVLRSMADYAEQLHKDGKITDFSYRDGDSSICMKIDGWLNVLYSPKVEGYLAGESDIEILTLEPYADETKTFVNYVISGSEGPDEGAELLAKHLNGFSFASNLDNADVTVETIRNLPDHSVILLVGHGKNSTVGPTIRVGKLDTSDSLNEFLKLKDYAEAAEDGAIWIDDDQNINITPIFIEKYMPSNALEGSVVYFNCCESYANTLMADSILGKGALAYLGNSKQVQQIYAFNAMYEFLEGLTPVATGSYCKSIEEALEYAKISYPKDWTGCVVEMSNTYDFSLPEMIALKDGTYDINEDGVVRVIDTDGNLCENYTMYIAKASNLNEIYLESGADITPEEVILYADETRTVNSKLPQKLNLNPGIYEIAFQESENVDNMIAHTFQVFEDRGNRSISVQTEFGKETATESTTIDITVTPDSEYPSGKCGDNLTWTLENGVLTISGTGSMYDYDMTGSDASPWFEHREKIISIQISSKATSIGDYAFNNCLNIQSITIPGSVKKIGDNAFLFCNELKKVVIENGVTTIGDYAFMECFQLTSIKLPDSMTHIGDGAFWNCYLKTITIPEKLSSIGDHVFETVGNNKLTEIRFTGNAPKFASESFYMVKTKAYYPGNNQTWTTSVLKNYGGDITWIAEGKTDLNKKALEAYRPIVEKAKKNSDYDGYSFCTGVLIDLDNDNVQELVLRYLSVPFEESWWSEYKLSVYDYENGKVITKLDGVTFGELGGAGEDAYATILYKSGMPYVMTYNDFGETSSGGNIKPNRVGTMTIYDGKTCKKVGTYRINRENNVLSYQINQKTVSEKEFVGEVEKYQGVDVVCDFYQLIKFPETFVTASELLQQMK